MWRHEDEYSNGYVFTAQPVLPGERVVIQVPYPILDLLSLLWLLQSLVSTFFVQVVETENMYIGSLAFGVTSCDPATVAVSSLPEDADMLLDRWTHPIPSYNS